MTPSAPDALVAGRTVADLMDCGDIAAQVAAIELLTRAVTEDGAEQQSVSTDATVLARASVVTSRVCDRLAAQRLGWLAVVEADGRWALDTVRTFAHWVALRHRTSLRTASQDVAAARRLRDHLPATAAAARAGQIGPDHVRALVRVADTQARRTALAGPAVVDPDDADTPHADAAAHVDRPATEADPAAQDGAGDAPEGAVLTGEDVLVSLAREHSPDVFGSIASQFAVLADPDATDRAYREASAKEYLNLAKTLDGYHLDGFLTDEHGQALDTALRAVTGRRAAGDTRTPAGRRAGALHALTRIALDADLTLSAADAYRRTPASADRAEAAHPSGGESTGAVGGQATGTVGRASAGAVGGGSATAADAATRDAPTHEGETSDTTTSTETPARPRSAARPHLTVVVTATELQRALARAHRADQQATAAAAAALAGGGSGPPPSPAAPVPGSPAAADDRPGRRVRPAPPRLPETGPWSGGSIDWREVLATPPAQYVDTTGPVPDAVLRRLACDGELARAVLGPSSEVLNVGRRQRTVTGPRREGVIARDRGCVWPGCEEPPHRCEVHHAEIPWAGLGETSTDNGALLCWYHHDQVDTHHITLTWTLAGWRLHRADGTAIETGRSRWLDTDDDRPADGRTDGPGDGRPVGRAPDERGDGQEPGSRAVAATVARTAISVRVPGAEPLPTVERRPRSTTLLAPTSRGPTPTAMTPASFPGTAVPDVVSQVEHVFAEVLARYG